MQVNQMVGTHKGKVTISKAVEIVRNFKKRTAMNCLILNAYGRNRLPLRKPIVAAALRFQYVYK